MDPRKVVACLSFAGVAGFAALWVLTPLFWFRDLSLGFLAVGIAAGGMWFVLFYRKHWSSPPVWRRSDLAGLLSFVASTSVILLVVIATLVFRDLEGLG